MLATQTHTIEELLETSREQDTHKADFKAPAQAFRFDEQSNLVPSDGQYSVSPLTPTRWAWSQIFNKLGPVVLKGNRSLPADYLLALKPHQRAALLNDHIGDAKQTWLVRSFDNTARAVLSDKYTAISNTELLDIVDRVAAGTTQTHSLTRDSSVNPDSLNLRIIWKDVDTGDDHNGNGRWGIGVGVTNGETGNRRGGIYPLIKRHSCDNSILFDLEGQKYEFLHLGSLHAKLANVKAAIGNALPFAAELLDTLIQADAIEIPNIDEVIAGICAERGWDNKIQIRIAQGTEGQTTKLGLVNGITFAAHEVVNPDEKTDFQLFGGAILLAPDSVFHSYAKVGRG